MTTPDRQDLTDWLEQQFELLAAGLVHDDLTLRSQGNAFDCENFTQPFVPVNRKSAMGQVQAQAWDMVAT